MVKIEAPAYGAISVTGGDVFGGERKGAAKKFTVALALLSLGCLAMVLTHGYAAKVGTVELEERPKMSIITTEDGRHVAVPPLQVNLKAGTTASYHSEFERNAADKAIRTTQLAQKVGATAAAKRTKFGLSARAAQGDVEAYFKREASAAARKQSPPKVIAFSGKAARKEEQNYFKQQAMLASQKQHPSLKQVKSAHRAAEKPPKHGESAAAADGDIDSYFKAQAAAAARTRVAPKVHLAAAPALHDDKKELHGVSAKAARSQLSGYFHSQSVKAAARRTAHKPLKEEPAPKGKAPKFGESAAAAQANINKYFGKEQKAARATAKTVRAQRLHSEEESDQVDEDEKIRRLKQEQDGADDDDEPAGEEEGEEEEEEEEPKADAAELEHPAAQVDHIGDVPVDAVCPPSFSPLCTPSLPPYLPLCRAPTFSARGCIAT